MDDLAAAVQETCLDLVAMVFLFSGSAKLWSLRSFREGLLFIPHMRVAWSYLVSWSLPAAEVVVAVGLFLNLFWAKLAAFALLLLFSAVVALVVWHRLKVPCGCFGNLGDRHMSAYNFIDNALLDLALVATLPLPGRAGLGQSLPVAAFLLLSYPAARELLRQRAFLGGLRKQAIL